MWVPDALCHEDVCITQLDGAPFYTDRDHLSAAGSVYVARALHFGEHFDALVGRSPAP